MTVVSRLQNIMQLEVYVLDVSLASAPYKPFESNRANNTIASAKRFGLTFLYRTPSRSIGTCPSTTSIAYASSSNAAESMSCSDTRAPSVATCGEEKGFGFGVGSEIGFGFGYV